MKQSEIEHETWLDLSQAAGYLGVHFTTLRRWADAGEIGCMRTPGGRRRFSVRVLDAFIAQSGGQSRSEIYTQEASAAVPCSGMAVDSLTLVPALHHRISDDLRGLPAEGNFLLRLSEEQRVRLKGTGQRLTALLFQYNSRGDTHTGGIDEGAIFLEEGRRIACEYSQVCREAGLSARDTAQVFLFFRRSILSALYQTAYLGGCDDPDGLRLYERSTDFFDQLLLALIGSYVEEGL